MSNELKQFYRELLSWVNEGCPKHPIFEKHRPLCITLHSWCIYNEYYLEFTSFQREQRALFHKLNDNPACPFNQDYCEWKTETRNHLVYKNLKRLAFIGEYAK